MDLAGKGARIALVARRESLLKEVADNALKEGAQEALILPCDVTNRVEFQDAITEAYNAFGEIDVLINNAGNGHFGYIEDTPQEHIESVFQVNVFALWYGTGAVLPRMKRRGKGHIITVSSLAGVFPFPADAAYVAAKHAAVGFNRALRSELAGTGVEASVVLPAGVMTDWALQTAGGPILPLFEYEGRRGAEIAAEQGVTLPAMPGLLSPEEVAMQIAALIEHPQPELYTHSGSAELVRSYQENLKGMEDQLHPLWLANREGYQEMRKKDSESN